MIAKTDRAPIDTATARRRLLVIANPTAGVKGRTTVARVASELARCGTIVEIAETVAPADVERAIAAAGSVDAVVAAGGDGTIRALATAAAARGLPLGILPIGTGNVMAREIGLGFSPEAIAATLARGPAIDIEGARANGSPFFLMAGVGFDAEIVARLSTPLKRVAGRAAYAVPTLQVLAMPLACLQVDVDGRMHEAAWVVVTRVRRYGGAFIIARDAGLARRTMTAVLFKPASRVALIRQMLALASGRIEGTSGVEHIYCERVSVRSSAGAAIELDGDTFGRTPLEVIGGGPRLQLIVPRDYAEASARDTAT